ncbi:PLxRFG domain-containing protein [Comamonas sp. NoAH]|uniref:PLxRFG domain-containing protein n=1 Tax=Comamonas halotolerans TaxID=3041496 RepID=UPI0024E07DFF|nr:PLxRFG domain-containing protein [Comamonas sp. NoAH]
MNTSYQPIPYDESLYPVQGGIEFTPIPKATGFQRLKDIGASFAGGAVGATKAIADAAGADNAVSAGLGRMRDATQGWLSAERQAEQERRAAVISEAEKGGSRLREIGAHLGGIVEAPVSTVAQAAGSVVPMVAAMAAARRGIAPKTLATGLGAVQGAGAVKGSIHEAVKDGHLKAGASEEAATAAADKAQAYGGDNTAQIALGSVLGGLAGRFGVEDMVARGMTGVAAAGGASALRRLGAGAFGEGVPETVQGGQERYASNTALQNEGFDTPTWQGVAGQAVAEGVAGGMLGGVSNAFARGQHRSQEPEPTAAAIAPALELQRTAAAPVIDPDDNPEVGVDAELSPVYRAAPNPADGPLSRNVAQEMERGALPEGQAAPTPRSIHERIQALPEQERTQAIILADEINSLDSPEGVRRYRRAELEALLQLHEKPAGADGPISRSLTAHRPSTALATSELTADDPANWHKIYRRSPVGVPYQNVADPLADAQQAVRQGTNYTDPERVQAVRNELEDAWLALNVDESTQAVESPQAAVPIDHGDITPEIDARVRSGRVASGVRNAFDAGAPNTLRVIQHVNQALRTIGESSLTQDEVARVRRVADARTAFMGLNLPAALPADPVQPVAAVDAMADNSSMEALIPERQDKATRATTVAQPAARAAFDQAIHSVSSAQHAPGVTQASVEGEMDGAAATLKHGDQVDQLPVLQGAASAQVIAQQGIELGQTEDQRKQDASERWARMAAVERQTAAKRANGLNAVAKGNVHTKPWADLSENVRAALLDAVVPPSPQERSSALEHIQQQTLLDSGARTEEPNALDHGLAENDFAATPIREGQLRNKKPLWERAGPSARTTLEAAPLNPVDQSSANSIVPLVEGSKSTKAVDTAMATDASPGSALRQEDVYPNPTADEIPSIQAGSEHFVQSVETREILRSPNRGNQVSASVEMRKTGHGALFSSRTTPPQSKLSLERIQQLVHTALRDIPGSPPVYAVGSPADIGLVTAGEDVHSGVSLRSGDIYVFQSGVGSDLDVLKTVFHELFHRGLRNILPVEQYVQSMLDLAKRDDRVQSYANDWKKLPIAAQQRAELAKMGFTGSELQASYEALAIEEGLATLAEELKAEKQAGTRSLRLRGLASWLASVADRLGFTSVANAIRRMTYSEAERFVLSAIAASGQPVTSTASNPAAELNKMRTPLTESVSKAVGDTIKGMTVQNVRKQAGFKVTDYMGIGLQFLGRRQLTEVYSPVLPQLKRYSNLMARMDADKNEAGAAADQLATEWGKLKDEAALAELMHDATLAQIDPANDYVEGDNKTDWKALRARFDALTPEARDIYQRARDAYRGHMRQVRQAIKERIERSGMTGQRKADMIKQMEGDFFGHIKGVYFPLARFGQYMVVVKNIEGKTVNVSRAETMVEADALRTTLEQPYPASKGYTVGKVLKSKDFVADRDTVGSGFIQELYGLLDKQGMDAKQRAELEDSIGQLYLASMPDLSWAKHGIHRKGTAGFSQDARRAFAQNTFHGARYLAKLRYSDQLQDELADMDQYISLHDNDPKYPSVRARQVLDEMVKRHDAAMNPSGNSLSTALTSFGFIFHLGLSPASAMVNLTQTALVAYPVMGAKWGFAKAGEALLRASKETVQGKNDISRFLNTEEKAAFDEAVRAGVIDVTMAHDLAGIAQGEDAGVMWKIRPLMKWASFLFHHAEKFNRSATFIASYRLARDAGSDHYQAYEEAVKATYDGHFDYSSNNRPRIMQGNVARVLLLFKQYSQNMIYAFARSAQQSMQGQTAKERAEARKVLAGLLVMHGMAAGALGLPMVSTLLAVASMLAGDDDEPFDAQTALQNMLADTFGQKPAEVLAHGLSRLTPWDVSGRVGLDNLIFPDLQEGLEGQRLAESAMAAALGPVAGIGTNMLRGVQSMAQGEYLRGLESMLPSFLRNPLKAVRYGGEGVKDKSGVVVKDEVDFAGQLGQFMGFSPSEVRLAYEGKAAITKHDRALVARRSTLMEQYALAAMAGDEEGKVEAREAIARFNEKNPSRAIKPMNLAQSVRMRQRRIEQAQEGVYLPMNRRDALGVGRFADQDDG